MFFWKRLRAENEVLKRKLSESNRLIETLTGTPVPSEKHELTKEGKRLLSEACKVYGIPNEYVFSTHVYKDTDEVVIVTNGGRKIRHRKGEPAKLTLSEVEITGVAPEGEAKGKENKRRR